MAQRNMIQILDESIEKLEQFVNTVEGVAIKAHPHQVVDALLNLGDLKTVLLRMTQDIYGQLPAQDGTVPSAQCAACKDSAKCSSFQSFKS